MVFIEGLKERFSLLCWFIQGCHQKRFLIKNKFSKDNIMISSFADFRISDLIDKLPPLLSNLDAQSIRNVENALEVNFMLHNKGVVADKRTYLSKEQIEEYNKFGNSDKFLLARKYGIDCKELRFKYIAERDELIVANINPKFDHITRSQSMIRKNDGTGLNQEGNETMSRFIAFL